jgi:hypothetical protein
MSTPVQYRRNTQQTRKKSRENETKNVDDSGGAHCISSTVVVTSFVRIERSNRKVRVTKRNEKRTEKKRKLYHKGSRDDGDADDEEHLL